MVAIEGHMSGTNEQEIEHTPTSTSFYLFSSTCFKRNPVLLKLLKKT